MVKADEIQRLCALIHQRSDYLHSCLMNEIGYLSKLRKVIVAGGFAAEGTDEEIQLRKSAEYLYVAACDLMALRDKLIANSLTSSSVGEEEVSEKS